MTLMTCVSLTWRPKLITGLNGEVLGAHLKGACSCQSRFTGSLCNDGRGKNCLWAVSGDSPIAYMVKNPPAMQETRVRSPGRGDPLEKGMAPTPACLPGECHGGLQSTVSQRAGHDRVTKQPRPAPPSTTKTDRNWKQASDPKSIRDDSGHQRKNKHLKHFSFL